MKDSELKTNLEVKGVILTEECIEYLKFLQQSDNEPIGEVLSNLSDAIRFIAGEMRDMVPETRQKACDLIVYLGEFSDNFTNFKKP